MATNKFITGPHFLRKSKSWVSKAQRKKEKAAKIMILVKRKVDRVCALQSIYTLWTRTLRKVSVRAQDMQSNMMAQFNLSEQIGVTFWIDGGH